MKTFKLIILFVLLGLGVSAQDSVYSGVVKYEQRRTFDFKFQGEMSELASRIPKERKTEKELIFNNQESLFRNVERNREEDVVQESAGGATMMIRIQEPENFIHFDISKKVLTEQREFMSRTFLIEAKTDTLQWKLTGNQKHILDFVCLEAELVGSEKRTIAWFTPTIPVSTGPDSYIGLPGLVLHVDIGNGQNVIEAKQIDLKTFDSKEISKPKNGRKVSRQEFNRIVNEKTKEMETTGGGAIIIRQRD
jgi:GLPGLI family protein